MLSATAFAVAGFCVLALGACTHLPAKNEPAPDVTVVEIMGERIEIKRFQPAVRHMDRKEIDSWTDHAAGRREACHPTTGQRAA